VSDNVNLKYYYYFYLDRNNIAPFQPLCCIVQNGEESDIDMLACSWLKTEAPTPGDEQMPLVKNRVQQGSSSCPAWAMSVRDSNWDRDGIWRLLCWGPGQALLISDFLQFG